MALIQCNFFSKSLMRTVPIQVVLPTDKMVFPGDAQPEEKPFKTLYLLHGIFGNYTDWVSGTRVQAWCQDKNLAVVMPSGDNSFYANHPHAGSSYGDFIGQELVDFTRRSFPLSRKREDTFIGGLSMGGYGAIVNGLRNPETFSAVCAYSSGLILDRLNLPLQESDNLFEDRRYYESMFGDFARVPGSDNDYNALAEKLAAKGKNLPRFYITCGTEDGLLPSNRAFDEHLRKLGFDVTYEEWPGGHDWKFWDECIEKTLSWLPLDAPVQGISSGHVSGK